MKKIITSLMILCMILPVCSAEEIDETQYVGTWIYENETINNGFVMEVIRLTEDHRVFYIYQTFDSEKSTYSKRLTGIWSPSEKQGINIDIYDGALSLSFIAVSRIYMILETKHQSGADYKTFVALSSDAMKRTANNISEKAESGVYVPAGYWEVGVDIPAGTYSIRNPEDVKSQNFIIYEGYNEESGNYTSVFINTILGKDNELIGKVTLKDGNIIKVFKGVYFDVPITLGF